MISDEELESHVSDIEVEELVPDLIDIVAELSKRGIRVNLNYPHQHLGKGRGLRVSIRPFSCKIKTKKS